MNEKTFITIFWNGTLFSIKNTGLVTVSRNGTRLGYGHFEEESDPVAAAYAWILGRK